MQQSMVTATEMSTSEAARVLGVASETLRAWVRRRKITARVSPLGLLFDVADVHRRAADEAVTSAASALEILDGADPLSTLTATELDSANRCAAFVKEDAAQLPLADLTRRITHALAGDDRPLLYLLARYGDARLQAEQASGSRTPAHIEARGQLAALVRAAGERFIDQRAQANAAERLATARSFRAKVWETTRPLNVAREVAAMRRSGRYSGVL